MVSPYYEDAFCSIYHGDCRDVMPDLQADAVITDPPYGLDFRGADWDNEIPSWWLEAARLVAPLIVFTTAPLTMWSYPEPNWVLCWARPASNSRATSGGFNHWSPVLVYGTAKFPTDLYSLHAIAHSAPKWITHPSPKPVSLYRWLVEHATPERGTVVDPFMGSGTTLRAAKDCGRKGIGIEVEERYCELAVERLTQEVLDFGGAA